MSHALQNFAFQSHQLRIEQDENGNPLFCAKDACTILGYSNDRDAISRHCKPKGVVKRDTLTDGGVQQLTFIDEGNLYRLIIKSNKPEAEAFESWVCDEVLPSIRKTGSYAVDMARYEEIESHLKTQKQLIDAQQDQIAYIRDKAERMVASLQTQLQAAKTREESLRASIERHHDELKRAVRAQRPIAAPEKAEIAELYQSGWAINTLVYHCYRNAGIVRRTLREKGLLA